MPSPSPDTSATSITGRAFAVRRKGFDPDEVRAYLGQLAEIVSRLTAERDTARESVGELQAAADVRPEIDEDQLTAVLGEETARVLSSARKASVEIKERAEESVARMLREAAEEAGATRRDAEADAARLRDEAQQVRSEAEEARRQVHADAEADAARVRAEADAEAAAAREAAASERAAATADGASTRAQADAEAARVRAEAEEVLGIRTGEAEAAAAAVRAEADVEAEAIRAAAHDDAAATRAQADDDREGARAEGREMVAEAQRVRERMLADLARRRKAARVQLEQLQAGRDRLLESYEGVRRTLDDATAGLRGALPEARTAAEAARFRAESQPEATVEQLEAEIAAARAAGLPLVAPADDDAPVDDAPAGPEAVVDVRDAPEAPVEGAPATDAGAVAVEGDDADAPEGVTATPMWGAPDADLDGDEWRPEADPDPVVPEPADAAAGPVPEAPAEPEPAPAEPEAVAPEPEPEPEAEAEPEPEPEPEPEAEAVAEPEPDGRAATVADDEPEEAVDELFAKLRASREASVAEAREVLGAPRGEAEASSSAPADAAVTDPEPDPVDLVEPGAGPDAPPAAGTLPATLTSEADLVSLMERRDGAIEPIENRIARKLKRVLADEQGQVLDGVRRLRGHPTLDDILPAEEQDAAYAAVVGDDLLAAAEEGAAFEGAALPASTSVDEVARELARALSGVVRPRVERCFEGGEDAEDISDRLRATYREWKTDRLVEATRHLVLGAFGQGQEAVRPAGAPVRWVADPAGPACPDCEDDALAGTVPSGEPFPTGHAHPPAHPGCRCLVVGELVVAPT